METDAIAALAGSSAAPVMALRADLMVASQGNYRAVITPHDPGGLGHPERLALACRIARLNGDTALADHYAGAAGGDAATMAALADPGRPPPNDTRRAAILRHVDLLTRSPKDATRGDIAALLAAGIAEADIVRLAQLIAFVNYQVRVLAGLRLIGAAP